MSWMWIPYFADIVGNLKCFLVLAGIVLCVICGFACLFYAMEKDKLWGYWKYILWCIPLFLFATFIPSKETIFQMAGFGAAETVIKSDTANKAVELANEYLTKQLKQIKQENKQ